MKMKAALKIIALIPLFLSLIIILAVFWATREMKASREMNRSAERIVENAFELNVITDQYLLYPGERPKIQFRSIHNSMKRALEKIKTKTTEEEDLLKDVRQNHKSVGSLFDLLVSIHERPTEVPSAELRETVMGQLLASSREIVSDSFELSRINLVRMDAVQGGVISFLLIVAFISGTGFASYSFLLGRRIERTNEDLHRQITERKRAEETLRKERDFTSAVLENTGGLVVVLDRKGRITRFNRTCEVITGYTSEEAADRVFWEFLVPPDELPGVKETWDALSAGDFPNQHENHWVARDGSQHLITWSNTAIVSPQGHVEYIIGTGLDTTERKRAEEALQRQTLELQRLTETLEERVKERTAELGALSEQLVSAQENERRRISYDLHDNAWQALVAIRFEIERLFSDREGMGWAALQDKAKKVMAAILETVGKIRSMQGDLWPYVLDDIGILATIDWYCREFQKSHPDLTIERKDGLAENEIPSSAKIVIYRILQETLSNVTKHSQASCVTLRLMKKGHRMEFTVEDNGIGFDPEETIVKRSPWGGLGFLNIKARTELSGGLFVVESLKGKGTTVRASWPI